MADLPMKSQTFTAQSDVVAKPGVVYVIRAFNISVQTAADGTFTGCGFNCTPEGETAERSICNVPGITATATYAIMAQSNLFIVCEQGTRLRFVVGGGSGTGGALKANIFYNELYV